MTTMDLLVYSTSILTDLYVLWIHWFIDLYFLWPLYSWAVIKKWKCCSSKNVMYINVNHADEVKMEIWDLSTWML